mgnify:CR=1 FL=1
MSDGVTHVSATVGWDKKKEERISTQYFNMQDRKQWRAAERSLEEIIGRHGRSLLFNYDDVACWSKEWRYKLPRYNEMLEPWLRG